jgi:asparagine synthase (glutamine-hydrolysing)
MTRLLTHRGPDDEGYYQGALVGLGMRRLSIIDLKTGHQPISNETGTVRVVFNGEIYNYRDLRTTLQKSGHTFNTQSDTEVLVHGYEEWGDTLPGKLKGMFAFALWDSRSEHLFLARDHFGIKPLYYTQVNGTFLFASEIKSLLVHPGVGRDLDHEALDRYLSFLYIPEPHTIFREIRALPPGHSLVCQGKQVSVRKYWEFQPEPNRYASTQEALDQIRDTFEESVQSMLMSDVPLGLFLSGGIDSTSILAMMTRHATEPVRTFSIGFGADERNWDELEAARHVAGIFKTEHHEFKVTPDTVKILPEVVKHFDQPFANPTAVILYLLSKETRRHVKVALAGTGGDEMFGGYPRYLGMFFYEKYRVLPRRFRQGIAHLSHKVMRDSTDGHLWPHRLRRFLDGGALGFDSCYLRCLVALESERKEALYSEEFRESLNGVNTFDFIRPYLSDGGDLPEVDRLMLTDVNTYLPYNQLAYGDRMSMAQSLEVRVPFVDQRVVEVAGGIPLKWKVPNGITKGLFREAMAPFLPREILRAPKRGLNLPVALWFRNGLREWAHSLLSPENIRKRGYFNLKGIASILSEHEQGQRDHSLFIWALIVLETWHQLYLD